MKKSDLKDYCEYLFIKKTAYAKEANWNEYSSYMCNLNKGGCIWAKINIWKFWKSIDDIDLDYVKTCHLRKELTDKISKIRERG